MFFDFETITNGVKHEPYLCWIYSNDIQQELTGMNTCAQDMLNALPIGTILFVIAHSSDYGCRFILEYLQHVKLIVKFNRFFTKRATYFNPIHKHKIKIVVEYSCKLIPLPLRDFGKCLNLGCHKEFMPYGVYTHQTKCLYGCLLCPRCLRYYT